MASNGYVYWTTEPIVITETDIINIISGQTVQKYSNEYGKEVLLISNGLMKPIYTPPCIMPTGKILNPMLINNDMAEFKIDNPVQGIIHITPLYSNVENYRRFYEITFTAIEEGE